MITYFFILWVKVDKNSILTTTWCNYGNKL